MEVIKMSRSKRVNVTLSDEMINFYQELADEMGIPRSSVMVMAMKIYMDQQKSLKMGDLYKSMGELVNKLEEKEML